MFSTLKNGMSMTPLFKGRGLRETQVLIDQTKTLSLTSVEESTLYRGQKPTLECFLSSKL